VNYRSTRHHFPEDSTAVRTSNPANLLLSVCYDSKVELPLLKSPEQLGLGVEGRCCMFLSLTFRAANGDPNKECQCF
jgi:hypothetical protein